VAHEPWNSSISSAAEAAPLGGSFSFKLTGAAAPELSNWNNCIFPEGGSLMGHYYWGDTATATGPFSGEVTLSKKELSERVVTKGISPTQSQLPGSNCAPPGSESKWISAEECSSSFSWSGTVKIEAPCESVESGHGYNLLSADMKAALHRLYAHLRSEEACFRFTVGARTFSEQEDLYNRWHQIADGSQNEPRAELEKELKEAHFAQFPKGWTSSGVAEGGPAKPGTSRHESGNAADVSVLWPPDQEEDVDRYEAAAKAAGLCGPPDSDPVHVELPYKKGKEKNRALPLWLSRPGDGRTGAHEGGLTGCAASQATNMAVHPATEELRAHVCIR
jgi:D-alanyl-D-alanine carboxypeptidase